MAYSLITGTGDGTTHTYAINFTLGFLSRDDVKMRVGTEVDGMGAPVYRTITWINDSLISIVTPPGVGVPYVISRTVSKTALQHNYSDGEPIIEKNLDESNLQIIMAVQEFLDGRFGDALHENLDMGNNQIKNLADGTVSTDAVNKGQLDAVVSTVQAIADDAAVSASSADASSSNAEGYKNAAQDSAAAALASQIAAAASAVSAAASANVFPGGFRNKFRNSALDIWQQGTAFTIVAGANPLTTADGWQVSCAGANISTGRTSPSLNSKWLLQLNATSGVTAANVRQRISDAWSAHIKGKTVFFQCSVYNFGSLAFTPTLTVNHANAANDFSAVTPEFTAVPLQSCGNGFTTVTWSGTLGSSTNGFEFILNLGGALNSATAGVGNIGFGDADLSIGNVKLPVDNRPPEVELPVCEYFFYKSYNMSVAPATSTLVGSNEVLISTAITNGVNLQSLRYPRRMIKAPNVTIYSTTGASGKVRDLNGAADVIVSPVTIGEASCAIQNASGGALTAGRNFAYQYTLDATL